MDARRKNLSCWLLKALAISLLILPLFSLPAPGQTTRVKGHVRDAETGEILPFVNIFFKGTQTGVTTDLTGSYTLDGRDTVTVLCASLLGYIPAEAAVIPGTNNKVDFVLKPSVTALQGAVVKPDNSYMKWILSQIHRNRARNNPENRPEYQCSVYNKLELDLTNTERNLGFPLFRKYFGFVFDYIDTTSTTGKPHLPVMLAETMARKYHRNDPSLDKEVITASHISGFDKENTLSQFTGSLLLKTNFYNNFINSFDVEIPSPIGTSGSLFYNYYIVDSLKIDARKTYRIRFHPKKYISSPAFDGEMAIDSADFALREIRVKLQRGGNTNWIRDLAIEVENQHVGDTAWFYKSDRMYIDLCPQLSDSSKLVAILGRRQMHYYDPSFSVPETLGGDDGYRVEVQPGAAEKDLRWWDQARPYALSEKERDIYRMVDSVQRTGAYRFSYNLINMFSTGYAEFGKISFGPYDRLYSFNNLEGNRFQLGFRTTKAFSRKMRLTAHGAYGTLDKALKGNVTFEYMFGTLPTRKLTLRARHDIAQLGKGTSAFSETNIFSSVLAKSGGSGRKMSPVTEFSARYEHEFSGNFTGVALLEHRTIHANRFVPMVLPDGTPIPGITADQLRLSGRFSWEESVTRGVFEKQYMYTRFPVLTLDLAGAARIGDNAYSYNYFRPEIKLEYRLRVPPAGHADIRLNAGKIFGTVPYPLLKLHEGNDTYVLDRSSFSCMNYYEFASDTWATLFYEHNFGGFFLGKIPGVRKLQLRELFTLRGAYGTISRQNDMTFGNGAQSNRLPVFPEGMSSLKTPYVEVGAGIGNILRVLRIDGFWRLTHRYTDKNGVRTKSDNCFALNWGLEFKF